MNCKKHGFYEETNLAILSHKIKLGCPKCHEEDVNLAQATLENQEKEKSKSIVVQKMEYMNLEKEYWNASLENFQTSTQELIQALNTVRSMVDGEILKILMTGKNGTGKTHLACAAIHEIGGRIMTMYEISTLIRSSYTALAKRTELEIVEELARIPLLVIDEIGRTKGSETEANWLSYIIDKRHVRSIPLILISNKHVKKDCNNSGCLDCLENYIGEDIMSRLSENSKLIRFNGEDFRRKKNK